MATTSSNPVAGEPAGEAASQGGNGRDGRHGLKAKVATGVAILGCAAALAFGGAQRGETAPPRPPAAHAAASMADGEQQERMQVAPSQLVAPFDWEQGERTRVAPGLPAATPVAPD